MDLRALMQKLEIINNKQYLTESADKKEKCCCDDLGQDECPIHSDDEPKKQSKGEHNESIRESADIVFKSSIARSLAEEFGYDLDERVTINPDGTTSGGLRPQPAAAPGQVTSGSGAPVTSGSGAPVQSGTAAPTADAAAAAKAKLTPSQLKWLGGADATDQNIMARMPKPLPGEAAPGGAATSAATGVGNPGEQAAADAADTSANATDMSMGQAGVANAADAAAGATDMSMGQAGAANAADTAQADAIKSGAQDDVTGVDKAVAANAAAPAAPAAPATPTAYKGNAGAQDIQKLNPAIKDVNKIQAGQKIKLPNGTEYTVKPGDTLDKIAKGGTSAPAQDRFAKAPPAPAANPAPAPGRKELDMTTTKPASPTANPAAAPAAPTANPAAAPAKTFAQDTAARKAAAPGLPAAPTRGGSTPIAKQQPTAAAPTAAAPSRVPKLPAAGTTSTQSNQSVQGTMKLGKPDGPITFNGKQVQPGAPEYAAASAALIAAQGGARNFKSRNDQNVEKNLAASGAPVTGGGAKQVPGQDFEESLSRMLSIAGLR